jgi:hypothetical protein
MATDQWHRRFVALLKIATGKVKCGIMRVADRWIISNTEGTMNRAVWLLLLSAIGVPNAFADGLIWRLPPDGTFVEFRGESQGEFKPVLSKEFAKQLPSKEIEKLEHVQSFKMQNTVTVSSVGEIRRAEQNCRWIELQMRAGDNEHVLKILVPEKYLTRGEDPLDHAVLTLFNPKDADRAKVPPEEGFNRIAYETDRFRSVFPMPLKNVRQLPRKTIDTPIGTFADCEVVAGTMEFDRPLAAQGRWEVKSSWQIALHPDAPFGVVHVQCQATGHEFSRNIRSDISMTSTLTISRKGNDAKSTLPGESGVNGGTGSEIPGVQGGHPSPGAKEARGQQ